VFQLITIPNDPTPWYREQSVNRVIMLKQFVNMVPPVFEALLGARSELLVRIQQVGEYLMSINLS
jgi:DNA mismatch repair protein MSH4